MSEDGFRAQEQAQQEGRQGQEELGEDRRPVSEAREASRGRALQRLVKVENVMKDIGTMVIVAGTAEELIEEIYKRHPEMRQTYLGLAVSNTRQGSAGRRYFTGDLPDSAQDIYIKLYLKKH
jgi:hypothetical protein